MGLFVVYARLMSGLFVRYARTVTGLFVEYARALPGLFPASAGLSAFFVGFERAQRENYLIYPLQPQNVSVARDPNNAA